MRFRRFSHGWALHFGRRFSVLYGPDPDWSHANSLRFVFFAKKAQP